MAWADISAMSRHSAQTPGTASPHSDELGATTSLQLSSEVSFSPKNNAWHRESAACPAAGTELFGVGSGPDGHLGSVVDSETVLLCGSKTVHT